MVHDTAALISVHGADCMNLMFLPPRGVMLEISPTHYGAFLPREQLARYASSLESLHCITPAMFALKFKLDFEGSTWKVQEKNLCSSRGSIAA